MVTVLKKAIQSWGEHKSQYTAASMAYYALLALPSFALLVLFLGKLIIVQRGFSSEIINQLNASLPFQDQGLISQFAEQSLQATNIWVGIGTILLLLFSASKLVMLFMRALNTIFEVEPKQKTKQKIGFWITRNIISFLLLTVFALLIIALVLINTLLIQQIGSNAFTLSAQITIGILLMTILFTGALKWMSLVKTSWSESVVGGLFLAILSTMGIAIIRVIFSFFSFASDFSIGAPIVLFLIWVNYMSMMILFGTELVRAYIEQKRQIKPKAYAVMQSKNIHVTLKSDNVEKAKGALSTLHMEWKLFQWFTKMKKKFQGMFKK